MTEEIASARVRFTGDLDPLEAAAREIAGVLKRIQMPDGLTRDADKAGNSLEKATKSGRNLGSALLNIGVGGVRAFQNLTQGIFFAERAMGILISGARKLVDLFLSPAMTFQKQSFALEALLGSEQKAVDMMSMLGDMANRFGLSLAAIQEQAPTLAVISDGDLQVAEAYAKAIARVTALRPDLPSQRQLGVVFALREGDFARASMLLDIPAEKLRALAGVSEETAQKVSAAVGDISAGGEQALGRFTSIVREAEGAGATGAALAENLKKGLSPEQINALLSGLGASDAMMEKVASSMIGNLQKLQNKWLTFRQTVGVKVLDALAGPMVRLLGWLEDNEAMVTNLAQSFGDFIANGIEKLVTWLDDDGFEKITAWLEALPGLIESVIAAVGPLAGILGGAGGEVLKGRGMEAPETGLEAVGRATTKEGKAQAGIVWKQMIGISRAAVSKFFGGGAEAQAAAAMSAFSKGPRGGAGHIPTRAAQLGIRSPISAPGANRTGRSTEVQVTVGVDPRNGTLAPYVAQEVGRNNSEIADAWSRP